VDPCNNIPLDSGTGYVTPKDRLAGRQQEIHAERVRKLEVARKQRQIRLKQPACCTALCSAWGAEFQTSGLATNETRHVHTALLIADTNFAC
jgi:hypothetical protein